MKYHIETWGCQMNVLDSQRMSGILACEGHTQAADPLDADLLLLNTCSVREKAETKVYSELGRYQEWKRDKPGRLIGVAGCVAQQEGGRILDEIPYVDFVLGTGNIERISEAVESAHDGSRAAYLEFESDSPSYQFRAIHRESTFQAFVTVIEGCDQFCTFCVVPFTRGRQRSRRAAEVEAEVVELTARGFTEITLLGQTVNAYCCPETGCSLGALLRRLGSIEGIRRLRFITSHPAFVTPEFIGAYAENPVVARFFHLPAQSGSDRILNRMKRRYTAARYLEILGQVRASVPGVEFSSDFIVGFPGETEDDFEATLDLVRAGRFSSLFAFLYSPRPGTAAARWGKDAEVPLDVAHERLGRLLELQKKLQLFQNRSLEGETFNVLVEGESRLGKTLSGRTSCNRIVHFNPPGGSDRAISPGDYVAVRIEKGMENSLRGAIAANV